jgi:ferritin-like protein
MVRMEKNHASSLSTSVDGLSNVVVREVLRSVAYDSQKHAGLYTAILSLLEGSQQAIVEEEYNQIEAVLKKRIEVESQMTQEVKQLLENGLDGRVKHLLIEIYEDEVRHHTLMMRLLEAVIKREAILKEDMWNMIWRDVPGHGTPIA